MVTLYHGGLLIAELEDVIQSGSKDKRIDTLRRITDLFVTDADRFSVQQIRVFDDVLGHLIKRIEGKALAELSQRLGPIYNPPTEVVKRLARDDNVAVAEPILTQSCGLSDVDLIEIARTKTQSHLQAISARPQISANVTDILLERGDSPVFHKLAGNFGANFSENGFAALVKRSELDEQLAERVGLRLDVPTRLFRELLLRATEAVRARLLALAGSESRDQIQRVLASISDDVQHEAGVRNEHDYALAHTRVLAMQDSAQLNEGALFEFAKEGHYADVVAALSLLCASPVQLVESLLQNRHYAACLVLCKAVGLKWQTVRTILTCRSINRTMTEHDLNSARTEYDKLSQSSAQRILRFWQVKYTALNKVTEPATSTPSLRSGPKAQITPIP